MTLLCSVEFCRVGPLCSVEYKTAGKTDFCTLSHTLLHNAQTETDDPCNIVLFVREEPTVKEMIISPGQLIFCWEILSYRCYLQKDISVLCVSMITPDVMQSKIFDDHTSRSLQLPRNPAMLLLHIATVHSLQMMPPSADRLPHRHYQVTY